MSTALTLLRRLSDGAIHSGTALGDAIGVSRAAVWKHLQQLQQFGLECRAVPGLGYQLANPLDLIDENQLRQQWQSNAIDLHYFLDIDSTNSYLLQHKLTASNEVAIAMAEFQHAGRGRRGRQWQSPFAANIYLSMKREFSCGLEGLSGLSLAVGVAIAQTLQTYCEDEIQLKWPNDIRAKQRKLGGILIELSGEAGGPCQVVIGFGINVHMQSSQATEIDQAWISLSELSRAPVSRTTLSLHLIENLLRSCEQFEREGFAPFAIPFNERDEYRGKTVTISGLSDVIDGVDVGVDDYGSLLVETAMGLRKIIAGEVSLRVKK